VVLQTGLTVGGDRSPHRNEFLCLVSIAMSNHLLVFGSIDEGVLKKDTGQIERRRASARRKARRVRRGTRCNGCSGPPVAAIWPDGGGFLPPLAYAKCGSNLGVRHPTNSLKTKTSIGLRKGIDASPDAFAHLFPDQVPLERCPFVRKLGHYIQRSSSEPCARSWRAFSSHAVGYGGGRAQRSWRSWRSCKSRSHGGLSRKPQAPIHRRRPLEPHLRPPPGPQAREESKDPGWNLS